LSQHFSLWVPMQTKNAISMQLGRSLGLLEDQTVQMQHLALSIAGRYMEPTSFHSLLANPLGILVLMMLDSAQLEQSGGNAAKQLAPSPHGRVEQTLAH
jgi:hypothetical protein